MVRGWYWWSGLLSHPYNKIITRLEWFVNPLQTSVKVCSALLSSSSLLLQRVWRLLMDEWVIITNANVRVGVSYTPWCYNEEEQMQALPILFAHY